MKIELLRDYYRETRILMEIKKKERIRVESVNIKSVGYDLETKSLEVEFYKGGIYVYFDVPYKLYESLVDTESVGRFFRANIRGKFKFEKVKVEDEPK